VTLTPSSTPSVPMPECVQTKQVLAVLATISAFLVGSFYVMYLGGAASRNPSFSSPEPARNHNVSQHFGQRKRFPRNHVVIISNFD
jgi:hypothetical protein